MPFATLVVMGQRQITLRRAGIGAILVIGLLIIGLWVNGWVTNQEQQPAPNPPATITVAAPTATPQPTPASFTYGVTVLDVEGQPIPHAEVTIEIGDKAPLEDEADSSGFARIEVPASHAERPGLLRVRAAGFEPVAQNIELYQNRLPNTVRLPRQ